MAIILKSVPKPLSLRSLTYSPSGTCAAGYWCTSKATRPDPPDGTAGSGNMARSEQCTREPIKNKKFVYYNSLKTLILNGAFNPSCSMPRWSAVKYISS